jgi:octanoyl-[GcvH]:protein N-octanoyltransferase
MITVLRSAFAEEDGLDVAVSRALLLEASEGAIGETFRLHVPGRVVAFGKQDVLEPGYGAAVSIARELGYTPVQRLAGGRAAVFHELTLSFTWTIPDPDPTSSVQARFDRTAALVVRAFARLGIDSEVGEIPGEYCPGRHSVNHRGRLKLMGVGQRLSRHAAHVGGVIVVGGADLVNRPLIPVYEALSIGFDPAATGSLQDIDPSLEVEDAIAAVTVEVAALDETVEGEVSMRTIDRARALVADHVADGGDAPSSRL